MIGNQSCWVFGKLDKTSFLFLIFYNPIQNYNIQLISNLHCQTHSIFRTRASYQSIATRATKVFDFFFLHPYFALCTSNLTVPVYTFVGSLPSLADSFASHYGITSKSFAQSLQSIIVCLNSSASKIV